MTDETPDTASAAAEALEAAVAERVAALEAQLRQRLVRAELKAHAIRAGMVDLDGLKLVDTSSLTLNDQDEVDGAETLMATLRRAKPWLFGANPHSTSSAAPTPPAQPPRAKLATEMTDAEWQASKAELLRRL